jgi:hypothetical protein
MKAELQIATVNTVAKEVPSDLMSVPFDDPTMISRFKTFLDTLFVHIPNLELSALCLGNEADIFWGTDSAKYLQYKTFMDEVSSYAKQLYHDIHGEDLKIGTTFTFHGLTATETSLLCASVNVDLDIIATTYYPLEPDFTMKDPAAVFDDFNDLVAQYNDPQQPIYFTECGYSSSELCLSQK